MTGILSQKRVIHTLNKTLVLSSINCMIKWTGMMVKTLAKPMALKWPFQSLKKKILLLQVSNPVRSVVLMINIMWFFLILQSDTEQPNSPSGLVFMILTRRGCLSILKETQSNSKCGMTENQITWMEKMQFISEDRTYSGTIKASMTDILCHVFSTQQKVSFKFSLRSWLDSDLIPRLLEIFENMKTFMVILWSFDAHSRIFGT